jgi:hypothetical protein
MLGIISSVSGFFTAVGIGKMQFSDLLWLGGMVFFC